MRRAPLLLLAALLSLAACGQSRAGPLVDVAIIDRDDGQWLPQYPHRGDVWVAGEPGHRYAVRLTNTTSQRVLVVLSVDGVNAVTGDTANPSQGGYVLDPWESTEITGWRKSLNDVAQFVFTDKSDSYAARTGRPRNVGVVGVAVFREWRPMRVMPAPYPPYARDDMRRESADAAASGSAAPASAENAMARERGASAQRIGTGHGAREWSPVGTTEFRRASTSPDQVQQIRYDEPRRLMALGVMPKPRRYLQSDGAPQAFPSGFVADPPRW